MFSTCDRINTIFVVVLDQSTCTTLILLKGHFHISHVCSFIVLDVSFVVCYPLPSHYYSGLLEI